MLLVFGIFVPCYLGFMTETVTCFDFGKFPSMFANCKEYKH